MRNEKLQNILRQLADLSAAELSEVKATLNEELERKLRAVSANGDLTEEEWNRLEEPGNGLLGCIQMVRVRTGLGLVDARAYVDRARAKGKQRPSDVLPVENDLTAEEWMTLDNQDLACCIRMVRSRTGMGLIAAKDYVDRLRRQGRPAAPLLDDNGVGPQRDDAGHTLYCSRGCCDVPTWERAK